MSREEHPTLRKVFNTTFALSQAITKNMSSSEPLPSCSNTSSVPAVVAVPTTGPATKLLSKLFKEMDEQRTSQPIDSSYILLPNPHRSQTESRARARIPTSPVSVNSPNTSHQSPTSSTCLAHTSGFSPTFQYSREHADSIENLEELASRFKEIQTTNRKFITSDPKVISNSLPNPRLRSFSNFSASLGGLYEEEFEDALNRKKKKFDENFGMMGRDMRQMIPKLVSVPGAGGRKVDRKGKGKATSDNDQEEEDAIEILQELFAELEDKERDASEDVWKSAQEFIGDDEKDITEKTNECKGKAKENVEESDVIMSVQDEKMEAKDTGLGLIMSQEISICDQETEDNGDEHRGDQIIDENEEHNAQLLVQPKSESGFEVTKFEGFGQQGEENWTKSEHDVQKSRSDTKIQKNDDTAQKVDAKVEDKIPAHCSPPTSKAPSIAPSSSGSSTNTSTDDDDMQKEVPEVELAAWATGVMVTGLWMIERKTRPS
ncbi:hypothetical protein SBOR_7487 [Sclerotinia borealis F-4128]|uniref:Uncharacterized protein n=1 Tax=Sclerotinia borealis (strain F-4128) TaxID=1432307 RepID=W9C8I0_SCLBF|nr:hypothetical protein SBOR_7487 [Sclerotinia borealis F-4128]